MAERIVYERNDGRWSWRLEADNGRIIAIDGELGYDSEEDARAVADRVLGGEFKRAQKITDR